MLNQPRNSFGQSADSHDEQSSPWMMDGQPSMRLAWLFGLIVLPMLIVTGRLTYLQVFLANDFYVDVNRVTESFEAIPCRDGRIFAADGRVLAYDIELYNIRMHYRWLEEPVDPGWLRKVCLSRLDPHERRNKELVKQTEAKVLEYRRQVWNRVAVATGLSPEELTQARSKIQKRVERILTSVKRRRREREAAESSMTSSSNDANSSLWQRAWRKVSTELTTPPRRRREPLVIAEERQYHTLIKDVSFEVAAEIETHAELYPGLQTEITTQRVYPAGQLAPHVIGYRKSIDDDELKKRRIHYPDGDPLNYEAGDRIGKTGVELTYNRQIRGLRGLKRIVKNRRGEILKTEIMREPRAGRDVRLTIDPEFQAKAEGLLDEAIKKTASPRSTAGGCIVVLDVRTGAVVAAASAPRFDLNLMVNTDPDEWERTLADPRRPLFPRATRMTVAPGSVFKTLSAIAVLESGLIDPEEPIYCQGYYKVPNRLRCYIYRRWGHNHGDMTLSDAIYKSCNVYFFTIADKLGPRILSDWGSRFGFGKQTGIDLPGERAGSLPTPDPPSDAGKETELQINGRPWYRGDTRGLAIGQAQLTVTPLQIARLMAMIANDGFAVTPHVVEKTDSGNNWARGHRVRGLTPGTLEYVRKAMTKVVANRRGTGYKYVRLKDVPIAGKTGTAEVGPGKNDHAWFAGFVPADRPRYAFAVVLEHAGTGGANAGPVAKKLVKSMLEMGVLRRASEPQVSMRDAD